MPLLHLTISDALPEDKEKDLIANLSRVISGKTGKPETYVMICITRARIVLGGSDKPAAFGDVRSIGALSPDTNRKLSAEICFLIERFTKVPKERVYLTFTDMAGANWGWKGETFG